MSKTRNLANSAPQFNSLIVPTGNTTQRPTVTAGQIRFNTDLGTLESANGTAWANVGSGSVSTAANLTSLTGNVFISSAGGLIDASNSVLGLVLPTGTYAQRPLNAANGTIRWNTSNTWLEVFVGNTQWQIIASSTYNVSYLIIAGAGGGGGGWQGGGGGAGGFLAGTAVVNPAISYTVTVGAGGVGSGASIPPTSGTNSSALGGTAIGGGNGGCEQGGLGGSPVSGGSGGSGGGGTHGAPTIAGGSGTSGQGNPGGLGVSDGPTSSYVGGGGGGASAAGSAATTSGGGSGGAGSASSISGSTVTYAGGGGGSKRGGGANGTGGSGGGGNAGNSGTAGTINSGGGGGAGGNTSSPSAPGASGGSGIVILTYLGPQRASGGSISISGGYTIHTFTGSGTFTA